MTWSVMRKRREPPAFQLGQAVSVTGKTVRDVGGPSIDFTHFTNISEPDAGAARL
jgi:hypothetical protein